MGVVSKIKDFDDTQKKATPGMVPEIAFDFSNEDDITILKCVKKKFFSRLCQVLVGSFPYFLSLVVLIQFIP